MKILLVPHVFVPENHAGVEVYTLNLAFGLISLGHEIAIAYPSRQREEGDFAWKLGFVDQLGRVTESTADSLRTFRIPVTDTYSPTLLSFKPDLFSRFILLLEEFKPDVVHFQHMIHMDPRMPQACKDRGIATVLHIHDYFFSSHSFQKLSRDFEWIGDTHSGRWIDEITDQVGPTGYNSFREYLVGRDLFLKNIDRVVAVSEFIEQSFLNYFISRTGTDYSRALGRWVVVVDNPTPQLDQIKYLKEQYRTNFLARRHRNEPLSFLVLGTIHESKGSLIVARAANRLRSLSYRLTFAGNNNVSIKGFREFELLTSRNENVRVLNGYGPSDLEKLLSEADALVFSSIWEEAATPLVIREARAAGLPVIAPKFGAWLDSVTAGCDGLLFENRNSADLASAMKTYIDSPQLLLEHSNNISYTHVSRLDNAQAIDRIYNQVLSNTAHGKSDLSALNLSNS